MDGALRALLERGIMVSRADDLRLRELLIERLGAEATDKLLERLPLTPVENFATKDDIAALRGELLGEFGTLRGEFGTLRGEFGELRGEFGELKAEFAHLRADISDRMRVQTWYLAGMLISSIGVTGGVVAAITA